MQLIKYNPIHELNRMERDMEKFWENGWSLPGLFTDSTAIDMYEEDGKLIAELALPHFKKDEVKITADNGILEISAEHTEKEEKKNKRRYLLREANSQFLRRVTLPEGAEGDKAEAHFSHGKLTISMPVTPKEPAKTIPIS